MLYTCNTINISVLYVHFVCVFQSAKQSAIPEEKSQDSVDNFGSLGQSQISASCQPFRCCCAPSEDWLMPKFLELPTALAVHVHASSRTFGLTERSGLVTR